MTNPMTTFEEAQAEALKARQAIDKLESTRTEVSATLALAREKFIEGEKAALDTLQMLDSEIGEARRELQTALQRQNDAPLQADAAPDLKPAEELDSVDVVADGVDGQGNVTFSRYQDHNFGGEPVRVNPFTGATERLGG